MNKKYVEPDPVSGQYRKKHDEGLYVHYPGVCEVHDVENTLRRPFAPRRTAIEQTWLVPSRVGWVAVCYETKGYITFFAQVRQDRAAWQRIEWPTNFQENWDEDRLQRAVENFLQVAEKQAAFSESGG